MHTYSFFYPLYIYENFLLGESMAQAMWVLREDYRGVYSGFWIEYSDLFCNRTFWNSQLSQHQNIDTLGFETYTEAGFWICLQMKIN